MKRKLTTMARRLSSIAAPLALALAVVTANSTCWWFTYQPDVPDTMKKYVK